MYNSVFEVERPCYLYSHGQEVFYKFVSDFTNKLVKQLLSMTVYDPSLNRAHAFRYLNKKLLPNTATLKIHLLLIRQNMV